MSNKIKFGIVLALITWIGFSAVAGTSIKPPLDFYPVIWLAALIPAAFAFFIGLFGWRE